MEAPGPVAGGTPGTSRSRSDGDILALLIESVTDYAIFVLDVDGCVLTWNPGARRLKGYPPEEIIGRHLSTFYTEEDRAAGLPQWGLRRALEDGRWEHEGWRVRRDGTRFWANVVITALRDADGRHRGFAKVTRDLTERKGNEDAVREALEREREASARLREMDQMKSDFVTVVAHDLGGPVGVIQNMLHLLETSWSELSDGDKLDYVSRMSSRANALSGLVNDLFDLARIEAGQLQVEVAPVDLAPVLSKVAADASLAQPGRRIVVDAPGPVVAMADERRTWQVLENLLSNALKFSPPDELVELRLEQLGGEVVVSVIDLGLGIPPDQEHVLFTRFGRLDQSASTPGTGMGLFIAKSLVDAQGGRLWVESAPGAGSTFRFTLPAGPTTP